MTTLLSPAPAPPRAPDAAGAPRGGGVGVAWGLGLGASAISLVGAGTPSFWGDEAASVLSAQRPWPSLIGELSRVDAVHGLYYALLHPWIEVVGATEFATRLPSVVAAGFAVAGVVMLGRRLFGSRVGILAGVVLAITPQFTQFAIETRSYAIDVAAAIWVTLLLVRLLDSPPRRARLAWTGYAVAFAAAIWMFVFLAFMALVHLAVVWALRRDRATRIRWARAAALGGVLALPLVVAAFLQRDQIAFLADRGYATPVNVVVNQWFGTPLFALVAWAALLAGMLGGLRAPNRRRATVAVLVWVAAPTTILLLVNAVALAVYNLRYPGFSLGGVALGVALGIDSALGLLHRRGAAVAAGVAIVALLAAGAWPRYLAQRGPYAKGAGSDLRQSSALLERLASPGDAVVFDQAVRPWLRPAMAYRLYPSSFARLENVALATAYSRTRGIWDRYLRPDRLGPALAHHRVVWAVEIRGTEATDLSALRSLGYRATTGYTVNRTVLYRMEKTAP